MITPPRSDTRVPITDASFLPNLSTIFFMKGMKRSIGAKPIIITTPESSALPKYVANIIVFAVVADCIPRNIPIAARVTPTAGRFFINLPKEEIMLIFSVCSLVLTVLSSTRMVIFLIINIKAINPSTPIISAARKAFSPMSS